MATLSLYYPATSLTLLLAIVFISNVPHILTNHLRIHVYKVFLT